MDVNKIIKKRDSKLVEEVENVIKPIPFKASTALSQGQKSVRNSKEVSQINVDRRASYIEGQVDPLTTVQQINSKQIKVKSRSCKQNLAIFMSSRLIDYIIIGLVGMFLCISFINFSFTSKNADENPDIALTLFVVSIIEMIILATFLLEIILKSIAFGVKVYFKDYWLVFDAIIIVLSMIMLLLDFVLKDAQFMTVSKVIRGVFRFLRLFLVFRKFNQVKKISNIGSRYHVRVPIEKILEIFNNMLQQYDDISIIRELKWSIEKLSSNILYEPLIEVGRNQKDANLWLESMAQKSEIKFPRDRKKGIIAAPSSFGLTASNKRIKVKLNIPQKLSLIFFDQLGTLNINSFELYEEHRYMILPYLLDHLFEFHGLYQKLNIEPNLLLTFGEKVAIGYQDNPYHNVMHSFDVTQTVNFFITTCELQDVAQLGSLDVLIMIIGAAVHDYDHPGQNNIYQINSRSELSLTYNDKSPLENHHISQIFFIIRQQKFNILEKLNNDDLKYFRERMIALILATDMANHFQDQAKLKVRLASEFDPKEKDKSLVMESILHAADISNPFKPFVIYQQWAARVLEEFWIQGDLERVGNMPITYLCDRYTTNTAKSQIGFIDFVVLPFYETLRQFLPMISEYMQNFDDNKNAWKEQIDTYEEQLKILMETRDNDLNVCSN